MNSGRWICYLLSLLRIHSRDCQSCNAGGRSQGEDMLKRLEELQRAAAGLETPSAMSTSHRCRNSE